MKSEKLAINGGLPVRTAPFAPWPFFSQEEIDATTMVLKSGKVNYWTGEEGGCLKKNLLLSPDATMQ